MIARCPRPASFSAALHVNVNTKTCSSTRRHLPVRETIGKEFARRSDV